MAESNFIEIDGSYLEGGGQILRISTALSVLLNKPIKIVKIRAGRKDGGLKPQHLTGIKLVAEISKAKLTGDQLKSTEVTFVPETILSGSFIGDTKTAGSVCLLLQNSLPCLIFSKEESKLYLRGGTNAEHAPQIDYFKMIFQPIAQRFGFQVDCEINRRGYFPKGGGEVFLKTNPTKQLNSIELTDFGKLNKIYGRAFVAGHLPIKIAQIMATTATQLFKKTYGEEVLIDIEAVQEPPHTYVGLGTGIIIVAETSSGCLLGSSSLGTKDKRSEKVAQEAFDSLIEDLNSEACVDQYLQDQLIIFMALAKGKSRVKSGPLTLHTKTAIHYTELLTGAKFNIIQGDDNRKPSVIIECDGIGYEPK